VTTNLAESQKSNQRVRVEEQRVIAYWRNSLADSNRMSIAEDRAAQSHTVPKPDVRVGRLDLSITRELFERYAVEVAREDASGIESIPILVCPVRARLRFERGVRRRGWLEQLYPLWIPAVLQKTGELMPPEQGLPWLSRDLLEPIENDLSHVTVGSVEDVDAWLGFYPWPPRDQHGQPREPTWKDLWAYACDLLEYVTGKNGRRMTVDDFNLQVEDLEPGLEYKMGENSGVLLDLSTRGAATNIINLYDLIANVAQLPQLLRRYTSRTDVSPRPVLDRRAEINASAGHYGQMNQEHPLSPSQREALHHLLHIADGEILAVNGPPGTGKTTLLQSVVASLWVERALSGGDPPVIVAASTNNQAVTNVIDSFGKVTEQETALGGRWLPGIKSYGIYCPSNEKMKEAAARGFQAMNSDGAGFPATLQTEEYVTRAASYFLQACRDYFEGECGSVEEATRMLHERLKQTVNTAQRGISSWLSLADVNDHIAKKYGGADGLTLFIAEHDRLLEERRTQFARIEKAHIDWLEYDAARPFWMTLFGWVPAVRHQRLSRSKAHLMKASVEVEDGLSDESDIKASFKLRLEGLSAEQKTISGALRHARGEEQALIGAGKVWNEWCEGTGIKAEPPELLERLDTALRYEAFKLATHYWEGRWLLEMREQLATGYEEKQNIQAPIKQMRKWRRYAKLTPCFVSTLYMLPKFFKAYQGSDKALYEFIDLLIIDEAGQVSPEVAGATFALARRALVVGDTLQIEPVWSIPPKVDQGNLEAHKVVESEAELAAFRDSGMSAASGSVMKIAQRQSAYQKYTDNNARGMFLSEHRRCVPEIIAYCNELAYGGRLEPKRAALVGYPLPHMGYAHVPGISNSNSGSRANEAEAEVIAKWIAEKQGLFTAQYPGKPLSEIVAVVTPFKRQKMLIQQNLRRLGVEELTVGTVHALQGAERHIIIFSSVYGNLDASMPFIDSSVNMLNVAISRAKDSFLVFGNMNRFSASGAALPSGKLARFLFSRESNEITDIELPRRETARADTVVRPLRTLEDHRMALADSINTAESAVWIASPYISAHAIESDDLTKLVKRATVRGVAVTVYVDAVLNRDRFGVEYKRAADGKRMLTASGAQVKTARPIHNKTICIDNKRLIEGSFNWLSAQRSEDAPYRRYERSLWYEGSEVARMIVEAVEDMERLVTG
jgi:hypothetical protein